MNETAFEKGTVYFNGVELGKISNLQWQKHPNFEGVFTKNLFFSKDGNNNLKTMLVKIEPHCEIGNHIHEGEAELHAVIYGTGNTLVNQMAIAYMPGVISFIPEKIPHSVKADDTGLVLLAKFTPPLN